MSARQIAAGAGRYQLLNVAIAGALAAQVGPVSAIGSSPANSVSVQWVFLYGSGGANVNAWLQTTLDGGATWFDIAAMPTVTTSAATKIQSVNMFPSTPVAIAGVVPTDGSLAQATVLNGIIGDRFRVKWTSTGTYAGLTSLAVNILTKP